MGLGIIGLRKPKTGESFIKRIIGIFGGSFNPPHLGHLHLAKEAYTRFPLDEIWFLVSPHNPLKNKHELEDFSERVEMCKLLLADAPYCTVSTFESDNHLQKTAETLAALQQNFPDTQFVWLMGSENWQHFHKWEQWQFILNNFPVISFYREDDTETYDSYESTKEFNRFRCEASANIGPAPQWRVVNIPQHKGRATTIRKQLAKGDTPEHLNSEQEKRIKDKKTFCLST